MIPNIHKALREISKSDDFIQTTINIKDKLIHLSYYKTLINHEQFHHDLLSFFQISNCEIKNLHDIKALIPIEGIQVSSKIDEIRGKLANGSIFIQMNPHLNEGLIVDIANLNWAIVIIMIPKMNTA